MQKNFLKTLSIIMVIAMFLNVIIIFGLQTFTSQKDIIKRSLIQIEQVKSKIDSNEKEIEDIKQNLNDNNIAKVNAFAYMINQDPGILEDKQELENIKKLLNVDELHAIDENGIMKWTSEDDMKNFDFKTSEQTKPFLEGIHNKNFVLAQEPQINGARKVLFQYIGVSRIDADGVVQIGMRPERLEESIKNNDITKVISEMSFGTYGYIFAVDKTNGTVIAHKNLDLIGKSYKDIGLNDNFIKEESTNGFAKIDGENIFYVSNVYNDILIGTAVPKSELYQTRNTLTFIFFIGICLIFLILIYIINFMLKNKIVCGIYEILNSLSKITRGDLDVTVNVNTNKEFHELSNGINDMVQSIRNKIKESEEFLSVQDKTIDNVKVISDNINNFSSKMLSVSNSLIKGSQNQQDAVEKLYNAFDKVFDHVNSTAENTLDAKKIFTKLQNELIQGNKEMNEMVNSMTEISNQSKQIGNIIKNIDDIAFQTNILALNAAVEAARAGDSGKGFSVVADEVRNLATKSAESAKSTAILVEQAVKSIDIGTQNVFKTAKTIEESVKNAKKSNDIMNVISNATKEQENLISYVQKEIEQITLVIKSNSVAAENSASASELLSSKVEELKKIMENSRKDT